MAAGNTSIADAAQSRGMSFLFSSKGTDHLPMQLGRIGQQCFDESMMLAAILARWTSMAVIMPRIFTYGYD